MIDKYPQRKWWYDILRFPINIEEISTSYDEVKTIDPKALVTSNRTTVVIDDI